MKEINGERMEGRGQSKNETGQCYGVVEERGGGVQRQTEPVPET